MSSLLKGILSKNNFPLEAHKASHNNTQTQDNTINFFCRNHSKKPIVFICTAKDCENNLLCAACVLDSPSLLIKYKDHIYTLQDYFEGSKNKILQVKIDKEFQNLRKRVNDVLEVSKDDIKRSFSGGTSTENPNFAQIEKKLVEASTLNSKEETLDKDNLQKFIKDAGKYEDLERKSYENGGCKGASALETRYFEFLVKIKSQVDTFCRSVQKQTSSFVDIVRELENISEPRDLMETRRTTNPNEVSMSVDAANHKRRLETSYNNISHNRSVMHTQEESSFVLNTETRESVREHAGNAKNHHQHQLKTILTNLSKNTSDNTTNPSSNSISPSYLPKPVPRAGLKLVKDFPSSNNPSIKDALAKHGPFRHENYSAANNNNDSSVSKRQRYGPIALENGDVYEGEWVEDRREGYGRLISVAGFFFDGFWKDNVAHGRGRLININGDMYEGDWENGKYHGRGTFIGVNGYQYTGDWSQDMQHGSGSEYWPDGSCYEGEYKLSKKHGKGVFKWANGEKYTGEFSLNNMHGNGVYEWPNGQKYYGYWAENKIMGEGRLEEPKAASQKMGEWDKKVLLSPDCALYKRELKSKGGEDLTVDPRYRFN